MVKILSLNKILGKVLAQGQKCGNKIRRRIALAIDTLMLNKVLRNKDSIRIKEKNGQPLCNIGSRI